MAIEQLSGHSTTWGGEDARVGNWGLYRPAYEKDSCGFGLIASLDDQASHWVIETAISSLNRLTHRGAIATDGKTGDGCGLLIKMPTRFLREAAVEAGFSLTQRFAAGLVFLDPDPGKATQARRVLTAEIEREKLQVAGFRSLPTDPAACGLEALKTLPTIVQVFVNAGSDIDESTLNQKLYMARRWSCSINDFPPTRCRSGDWRTPIAISRTTGRSTRYRAIAAGPWRADPCF